MRSFATTPLYAFTLLAVVIAAPTHNTPLPLSPHIVVPGKSGVINSRAPNIVPQDQRSRPQPQSTTQQPSKDDPLADCDKQLDETSKQSYDILNLASYSMGIASKRALPASPIRGVADITLSLGPAANRIGINNAAPAKNQAGQFNGIGIANAQQQQQQANQQLNAPQQQQANAPDFNGPGGNIQGDNFITNDGGNNGEALTNHGNGDGEVIVANNGVGADNTQGTDGQRIAAAADNNALGNNGQQQPNALQGGGAFQNQNQPVDRKRSTARRRDATDLQKKPGYYRKRDHADDDKHDGHYEDDDEDCDDKEYSPDFKPWTTSGKPSDRSHPEKPPYQSHPDVDDGDCDEEDGGKFEAKSPRPNRTSDLSHPDDDHDDFKPRPDHDHEDKFLPADHDHDDHKPSVKTCSAKQPSYLSGPGPDDEDCDDEDENKPKGKLSGPMEATYQPRPDQGVDDKSKSLRKPTDQPAANVSHTPEIHGKPDGKVAFQVKDNGQPELHTNEKDMSDKSVEDVKDAIKGDCGALE